MKKMIRKVLTVLMAAFLVFTSVPEAHVHAEGTITTDKTVYNVSEPIIVTTDGAVGKDWVGLYKKGEVAGSGPASIAFYYPANVGTESTVTEDLTKHFVNNRELDYATGGEFTVALYADDGYTVIQQLEITIVPSADTAPIYTEKDTYGADEPIPVVTNFETNSGDWVGLYSEGASVSEQAILWYYFPNGSYTKANILDLSDKSGDYGITFNRISEVAAGGTFKLAIVRDVSNVYTEMASKNITIAPRPELAATFSQAKKNYKYGEAMPITSTSPNAANPWVGLYDLEDENLASEHLKAYKYHKDLTGETDFLEVYGGNIPVGQYKFIVFRTGYDIDEDVDGNLMIYAANVLRTYGDPTWTWAEDSSTATATFTGTDTDTTAEDFTKTVEATVESTAKVDATCSAAGSETFTATAEVEFPTVNDETEFTNTKIVELPIDPTAHTWGEWEVVTPATEEAEGLERRVCANNPEHVEERAIPKLDHVHNMTHAEAKDATCTEHGNVEYWYCEGCGKYFSDEEGTAEIAAESVFTAALGHSWSEWTVVTEPTYIAPGSEKRTCSRCNEEETREIAKLVATLTTDKEKYEVNEPIVVTAEGGKWVRVYKKGEDPTTLKSDYFFGFETDGESHNIYNPDWKGTRAKHIVSIPGQMYLTVYLFADDSYAEESIIAQKDVYINKATSPNHWNLSVDPTEYNVGDPVFISASSNGREAWVGIYEGTYSTSDTFTDKEPVEKFYVAYADNKGKTIEGLPAGEYTAVIYGANTAETPRVAANFEVKDNSPAVKTDKEEYVIGEPIYVTVSNYSEYYTDGSDNIWTWVGLYKENETPAPNVSTSWYYLTGPEPVNIVGDSEAVTFNKPLQTGRYKVMLFDKNGGWGDDIATTYITIKAEPTEKIFTDKETYTQGESILLTVPEYDTYEKPWISLYSVDEDMEIGWFYVDETCAAEYDLNEWLPYPGTVNIILYGEDNRQSYVAETTVTINSPYPDGTVNSISKNKEERVGEYKYGEPVLISATSPNAKASIRLCDWESKDPNGFDNGFYVEYPIAEIDGSVDIVAKAIEAGKAPAAGKQYRVYLIDPTYSNPNNCPGLMQERIKLLETYYDDDAHIDWALSEDKTSATVTFHRNDDVTQTASFTATDITKTEKTAAGCTTTGVDTYTINFTFPEGEELVTVNDKTSFTGTVDVETPALGHAWSAWETVTPATNDQPGVEKHVCTRCGEEETREIPVVHDHVLVHHEAKDATCEEAGNIEYWECSLCGKYFSDAEGTVEIDDKTTVVVAALGHDWSEWTFDEENHKHSRTCSHDASHVETEDCTPGEAFYEDGKLMHKCTVCEGEWVEKVVLSTDKKEYDLWEQIMVTVNGEFGPKDWVGIYKKGDHYGDSNPNSPHYDSKAVKSIFWYYISEEPNPTDILRTRNENEREADYGPGEFTIYLFANDAYELITSVDVTVTEESVEIGDYVMKLNGEVQTNGQHTDLTVGDEVKVNTAVDGQTGTSWVGLYNMFVGLDQDFTQFASTDWYWVRNHNGEDYSFPELDTSVPGEYTVVLFGNGGHDDARMAFTFKISKKIKEEVVTQEPTCTRPGNKRVTYDDGTFENIVIPALGHDYQFDSWIWEEDFSAAKAHFVCSHDEKHTEDVDAEVTSETGEEKIVYTAKAVFEGKDYTDVKEAPIPEPVKNEVVRLSGKDRYLTSLKAADELKAVLGVEKFDSVILATGINFADALGGGYLAARKSAPILLTSDKKAADVNAYINANLKEGGTVYVLGGTGAVSEEALQGINGKIVRLSGKTRYDTNLAILTEAGVSTEEILIASGENFADALAASASGRPMLLVNTKKNVLSDAQKAFLASHTANKFYILGGTGAVSADIETALKEYSTPERVKGASRYETSVEIAKKFFPEADKALIAFSDKFPDGLCAGPLAYALKSPILLTKEGKEASLTAYCTESDIHSGYIVGGEAAIPDITALTVFSLPEDTVIVKK